MASILLIEDDSLLGAMIREMLEMRQHQVAWVHSGLPALRLLTQGYRPDVILTDIVMPDMDGLETIRAMVEQYPAIPLVAMSADVDSGYLSLASRIGAVEVLPKPFTQSYLIETLNRILCRRASA